jgi:hypothetical protein
MATFIPGKVTVRRRRAAMQASLFHARENRADRLEAQIKANIHYVASTPNPDAESGTEGDGRND